MSVHVRELVDDSRDDSSGPDPHPSPLRYQRGPLPWTDHRSRGRPVPEQQSSQSRRSPGRLEHDVHAALLSAGPDGATAADVIATVDPTLAYTTVVTTLARLVERGVLARRRVGRAAVFTTVGEPGAVVATSTARRMNRLLAAAPDRPGALAQFVAGLSAEDEARLAELLVREVGPG